ncbi:MAG: hypothetical protein ACKVRO_00965 [Micropepsaceae bacterium]
MPKILAVVEEALVMGRLSGGAAVLAFAVACAPNAPIDDPVWRTAEARYTACVEPVDRDPAFSTVNDKLPRQAPSLAQLADRRVPDEAEASALRLRAQKARACRTLRLDAAAKHHPGLAPAYQTLDYQSDQVLDYLQQGAIDYGTANRLLAEAGAMFSLRRETYFGGAPDERAKVAEAWSDQLQRGHSNPPPPSPALTCDWEELNIMCR